MPEAQFPRTPLLNLSQKGLERRLEPPFCCLPAAIIELLTPFIDLKGFDLGFTGTFQTVSLSPNSSLRPRASYEFVFILRG